MLPGGRAAGVVRARSRSWPSLMALMEQGGCSLRAPTAAADEEAIGLLPHVPPAALEIEEAGGGGGDGGSLPPRPSSPSASPPAAAFTPAMVLLATAIGGPAAGAAAVAVGRWRLEKREWPSWRIVGAGLVADVAWGLAAFVVTAVTFYRVPDVSWNPLDHLLFLAAINALSAAALLPVVWLCPPPPPPAPPPPLPTPPPPPARAALWAQAYCLGLGFLLYKVLVAPLFITVLYVSSYQGPHDRGPVDVFAAPALFGVFLLALAFRYGVLCYYRPGAHLLELRFSFRGHHMRMWSPLV